MPEEFRKIGDDLFDAGRYRDAVKAYRQALQHDKEQPDHWYNLARSLRAIREFDDGLKAIARAIELDSQDPDLWHLLGNLHRSLWQFPEAIKAFNNALDLDPQYPAHNNLGLSYHDNGQDVEAVHTFSFGLEMWPDDADLHENLGSVLQSLGRTDEAAQSYWRAGELDPGRWGVVTGGLRNLKAYDLAIAAGLNAIHEEPDDPHQYQNLGNIYKEMGRYEEAIEQFQLGLDLDPENITCLIQLGKCALYSKQFVKARNALLLAARLDIEEPEIRTLLSDCYFELGDRERALLHFRAANRLES